MNLTNQCNLSCHYCYEFGEDKVATPEGKPKFMDHRDREGFGRFPAGAVAGRRRSVHITFFGGETLMNFPLLKQVVAYATERAAEQGRTIDFSLTTNATLLTPAIIEFLSENQYRRHRQHGRPAGSAGQDAGFRQRARQLRHHRAAREGADCGPSHAADHGARHSHQRRNRRSADLPPSEETTSGSMRSGSRPSLPPPTASTPSTSAAWMAFSTDFHVLADEYLEFALRGEMHGFSNVSDTIAELYQGVNKSHPCGAALGLVGVGPSGDIAPCHRFVDSDTHALGNIATGIDQAKAKRHFSIAAISTASTIATPASPVRCAPEAAITKLLCGTETPAMPIFITATGSGSWTDTCLRIFGTISAQNPEFLQQFAERKALN